MKGKQVMEPKTVGAPGVATNPRLCLLDTAAKARGLMVGVAGLRAPASPCHWKIGKHSGVYED
jgi:hypothetical protein